MNMEQDGAHPRERYLDRSLQIEERWANNVTDVDGQTKKFYEGICLSKSSSRILGRANDKARKEVVVLG